MMEQRRMTGSGMWTNFFAGVLAAIAFSPVCLSAAPELATANGNDTAITQTPYRCWNRNISSWESNAQIPLSTIIVHGSQVHL